VVPIKGGPAEKAGVKNYDIIQAINGKKVETAYDLQGHMFGRKVGEEVKLSIIRLPRRQGEKVQKLMLKVKLDGDGIK
jgi:S1-C subfamily serine protease